MKLTKHQRDAIAIRDGGSERGISWSDMAILLRSVRKTAEPITSALRAAGVPNLTAALTSGVKYRLFGPRKGSQLTVWTRGDGRVPVRGGIHLTYYIGQNGRADLGGHHVHDAFFVGAKHVVKVRPRGPSR